MSGGGVGSVRGGVFLAAFTWGWWNGGADAGASGDGDGLFDAYEGWRYGYDYCVRRYSSFTPQYCNASVLRSVELDEDGVWHWLLVRDESGSVRFSRWIRAE